MYIYIYKEEILSQGERKIEGGKEGPIDKQVDRHGESGNRMWPMLHCVCAR